MFQDEVRLLTFFGPGGTGKTRLALQVAGDIIEKFEDGIFFVFLGAIVDAKLVASAIAASLIVRESGERPLSEGLREHLAKKNLLLVLDNFEHVIAAKTLILDLLVDCSRLKVLVTSREMPWW